MMLNMTLKKQLEAGLHAHEILSRISLIPIKETALHMNWIYQFSLRSNPQPRDTDKHLYLEETRTVSYGDIKSGWKSDFSGREKLSWWQISIQPIVPPG